MKSVDVVKVLTGPPLKPNWLVPEVLLKGSMVILAGDAGTGKSMLCYSLAVAIASGEQFLGRRVEPDKVLYFDEENSEPDSCAYLKRVWIGMGCPEVAKLVNNFHLYSFSLTHMYLAELRQAAATMKPALIIIDTANSACRLTDENDNAEASFVIKGLRAVKEATGRPECVMLILKHAKVTHDKLGNEYRDIRGAKVWKSELDGVIIHTANPGRPPSHNNYRHTFLWPTKSRAYGLLRPIEVIPVCNGDGVSFDAKSPV